MAESSPCSEAPGAIQPRDALWMRRGRCSETPSTRCWRSMRENAEKELEGRDVVREALEA